MSSRSRVHRGAPSSSGPHSDARRLRRPNTRCHGTRIALYRVRCLLVFTLKVWRRVMLLTILSWAVFGLVVGAIARLLYPGRQARGIFATMALGVVGSLLGGLVSWAIVGDEGG